MSRGSFSIGCATLLSCASSDQPIANAGATSSATTDIEISVQSSDPRALPPATATPAVATAEPSGLPPECDAYWTALNACNEATLSAMPAESKEMVRNAFAQAEAQIKEAWREVEGPGLVAACKAAMDVLASNPNCPK